MTQQAQGGAFRETTEHLRREFSPRRVEERLEGALSDHPFVRHALDLRVVVRAVLVSAVIAAIVLLISRQLAAIVLIVSFLAAWRLLAGREYDKRRSTTADED